MNGIRFAAATTLVLAIALAGSAAPAHAMHIGFYGTYGAGQASGDADGTWGGGDWTWDRDTEHTGFGFAMETPMGFGMSYRLGLGWERIESDGGGGSKDGELEGVVIDNDFTFDLVASPMSRLWIGPEFRLGFFDGSLDNAPGGDRSFVAAGIGPVLGFDLALGPSAALSWKAGYLYTWYYADEDSWDDGNYHGDYYDDSEMDGGHAYVSMAVLFRLWGGPPAAPPPGTYQPQGRW
jgi:hypothetical protein